MSESPPKLDERLRDLAERCFICGSKDDLGRRVMAFWKHLDAASGPAPFVHRATAVEKDMMKTTYTTATQPYGYILASVPSCGKCRSEIDRVSAAEASSRDEELRVWSAASKWPHRLGCAGIVLAIALGVSAALGAVPGRLGWGAGGVGVVAVALIIIGFVRGSSAERAIVVSRRSSSDLAAPTAMSDRLRASWETLVRTVQSRTGYSARLELFSSKTTELSASMAHDEVRTIDPNTMMSPACWIQGPDPRPRYAFKTYGHLSDDWETRTIE